MTARTHVTLDELLRLRHRARGFNFLPRQPVHSLLTGRHGSRLRGRGLDFEELRHYVEGDDTRLIDWSATARRGEPQVRVYREERDRSVLLLVDQRLSMFFGSQRAMKSVAAAEVAALAAFRVASLGDRVGAVVFSESEMVEIRPQAREAGVRRILAEVVRQNRALSADAPPSDPARLNDALGRAARYARHDCLVCLISDGDGVDTETARLITAITAHNDVLAIAVHDPLEADLPDIGRTVLAEAGGQIEVDLSASPLRRRFAADFAGRRASTAKLSLEREIPVLTVTTHRDVAEQLREQLGRRIAHGRAAA